MVLDKVEKTVKRGSEKVLFAQLVLILPVQVSRSVTTFAKQEVEKQNVPLFSAANWESVSATWRRNTKVKSQNDELQKKRPTDPIRGRRKNRSRNGLQQKTALAADNSRFSCVQICLVLFISRDSGLILVCPCIHVRPSWADKTSILPLFQ